MQKQISRKQTTTKQREKKKMKMKKKKNITFKVIIFLHSENTELLNFIITAEVSICRCYNKLAICIFEQTKEDVREYIKLANENNCEYRILIED